MTDFGRLELISLGGVGGCELASSLRKLDYPAYPYDWIVSAQSFILLSFEDMAEFFSFDERYVHAKTYLISRRKNAVMLHDFKDFFKERQQVKNKYEGRYKRLHDTLKHSSSMKKQILFVRIMENLSETLFPPKVYDNIFIREEDDLDKWHSFIGDIATKHNIRCRLLLITNNTSHVLQDNHTNLLLKHVPSKDGIHIIAAIKTVMNVI